MAIRSLLLSLLLAAVTTLALPVPISVAEADMHRQIVANRPPLESTPFVRLPLGSVRAEGWLRDQLELQRDGLTGAAESLYDALGPDSGWLGGNGENWERGPYYVRGLVALAHTLDDQTFKNRATKWIDWAIQSQRADGWFGPGSNDDWWPRMVVLDALRSHYEATGDTRVLPFLQRYFRFQLTTLPERPLRDWGKARAGDNIDVVLWVYNLTGEAWLLDLAELLHRQAYPWSDIYTANRFHDFGADFHPRHIVNVNQAMKTPAVVWQFRRNPNDFDALRHGLEHLNREYGRIDGQISGTEMLSGRRSIDGVELCADVERIISNAAAICILGDASLGDDTEKVAYNSLPAHTTSDLRQITYYQFPNQVAATHGGHGFEQDYANGNMPGPHSGFPCCCYNWHAGWPRFVQSMWAATADGGLAAMLYGPNRVSAKLRGIPVEIEQQTDYPFRETIRLIIRPQSPCRFPLALRVPAWCESPEVLVNGETIADVRPGGFARVEREWHPGDEVSIRFPMKLRKSSWVNDSVGLERGPLAFALKIDEQFKSVNSFNGFDEFEVRPGSPWNLALDLSDDLSNVEVIERAMPRVPFDHDNAPIALRVSARAVPSWTYRAGLGRVVLGRADGNWHGIAQAAATLDASTSHTIRVVSDAHRVRVFIDGADVPIIDRDDISVAPGSVGLRAFESAAEFTNVRLNDQEIRFPVGEPQSAWRTFGGRWTFDNGVVRADWARDAKLLLQSQQADEAFTLEATLTVRPGGDAGVIFGVTDIGEQLDQYSGYYVGISTASAMEDADEPPRSPVRSSEPLRTAELIPFGSTKIRVSYFPVLE